MYSIDPLVVAYGPHREKSRFTYMHHAGEKVDIPYVSWLLQGNGKNILIDVGCTASEYAEHIRPNDRPFQHAGETFDDVQDVRLLDDQLRDRGLTRGDIDMVVLTHLDWDHCMSAPGFDDHKMLVQRAEWEGIPAHPFFKGSYAPQFIYDQIDDLGIEVLDGDHVIDDDLQLILTPGHTPGGQSVIVNTPRGRYVIAGMCVLLENFYPAAADIEGKEYSIIPPGGHTDLFTAYDEMLRIKEIGGDNVLPLHMSEVMTMDKIG